MHYEAQHVKEEEYLVKMYSYKTCRKLHHFEAQHVQEEGYLVKIYS